MASSKGLEGAYPGVPATLAVAVGGGSVQHVAIDPEVLNFSASTATEFAIDLAVANIATGALSIVAGTETTDQTAGSAVAPDVPAGFVGLFTVLVDATDAEGDLDQSVRGDGLTTANIQRRAAAKAAMKRSQA